MSETTDFYVSWFGCSAFGAVSSRLTAEEPIVFQPTDLSNCSVWLDATDNLTIHADLSGNVGMWDNKGDLSGSMIPFIGQAVPTTNIHMINGNNTIWFDAYQSLYLNTSFHNQEFTFFVVTTTLSDLAINNYADWFGGFVTGAFSAGLSEYLGDYYTGCGANAIDNYVMNQDATYPIYKPTIYSIRSSSNTGTNEVRIDGDSKTLAFNSFSGYLTTATDYAIHYFTHPSSIDISEIIVYNRALSDAEVLQVNTYLGSKYTITI